MAFNELEVIKMIDEGKLSDKEIKLLTEARNGLAAEDYRGNDKVIEKDMQGLIDRGLIYIVPLSHPRAELTVDALVPTERGITVLNLVKAPTAEEARLVPSIETKPLAEDQKQNDAPELSKAAKNDEVFKAGGKDLSDVKEDEKIDLKDVEIVKKK